MSASRPRLAIPRKPPSGRRPRQFGDQSRVAYLMAAPALIGLLLYLAIPFLVSVYMSFTNKRLGNQPNFRIVGFERYERVLTDPEFLHALFNNAVFAAVVVPLQTGLALGLALALNQRLRAMAAFRTFFFMPVVFPMALVSVVWILILAPGPNGMLNAFLETVTLGSWTPVDFLRDPDWAMPAIIVVSIWQGVGFQMVILLAGLQSIPASLYEAASIDLAGPWNQFRFVTLPSLRNTLIFVVTVTLIFSFRLFDQVNIMTDGGPLNATTTVMHQTVSTAFDKGQIGTASAMTVIFFVIVLVVTLIQRRFLREEREIS